MTLELEFLKRRASPVPLGIHRRKNIIGNMGATINLKFPRRDPCRWEHLEIRTEEPGNPQKQVTRSMNLVSPKGTLSLRRNQ